MQYGNKDQERQTAHENGHLRRMREEASGGGNGNKRQCDDRDILQALQDDNNIENILTLKIECLRADCPYG